MTNYPSRQSRVGLLNRVVQELQCPRRAGSMERLGNADRSEKLRSVRHWITVKHPAQ